MSLSRQTAKRLIMAYERFWSEEGADRWRRGEAEGTALGDLLDALLWARKELDQVVRWGPVDTNTCLVCAKPLNQAEEVAFVDADVPSKGAAHLACANRQ